jgi:5-hydroxyisourate hydrolase
MNPITTHVLDTSLGRPAAGVPVLLEIEMRGGGWKELSRGATDGEGRLVHLVPPGHLAEGTYRLTFDTRAYFRSRSAEAFYRQVTVEFTVSDAAQHYHIPLLLGPYGYTTYRGS